MGKGGRETGGKAGEIELLGRAEILFGTGMVEESSSSNNKNNNNNNMMGKNGGERGKKEELNYSYYSGM